ncbi:SprT family zinc-dependent metalloprotease [Desulfococcaceae bacterium HSG8]|nr:SprT family zinc-dependent metalloprotease [Desulfococcaceae bacterium HSG8]
MEIRIDRGGELVLYTPGFCLQKIEDFVREKKFWIYTKLAEKEILQQPIRKREFVDGEGFLYLGRSHRLRIADAEPDKLPLRLHQGWFVLDSKQLPHARECFVEWYTDHGMPWIKKRIRDLKNRIGVRPKSITVKDLGAKWGHCTPDGKLCFHWRTILLPPNIIEYVIVHEMTHLLYPNHDEAFWLRVGWVVPDFSGRKQWLAENGILADM